MTADPILAAKERLTQRVKDRTGTLSRSPVVDDVAALLAELSRLERENATLDAANKGRRTIIRAQTAVMRSLRRQIAERDEALKLAEPIVETVHSLATHPETRASVWAKLKTIRALLKGSEETGESKDASQ